MRLIRVAGAALNQTPLDWHGNLTRILAAIDQARQQQASLLCLPELCITGYGCEDAFHATGIHESAIAMLEKIVPATAGMVVSVGLPIVYAGAVFNTACLIVDRQIIGFVAKQFLAGDGIHYEPRWFKPWPNKVHGKIELLGETFPIGDVFYNVGGIKIGFEICEDAWVGTRPGGGLASRGVDLILNPSASHFEFGKQEVRTRFVLEGSRAFHVTYVYSNLMGVESGRAIFDGDVLVASAGRLIARGPRLSYQDVVVTTATVDIDATRMSRARTGSFEPEVDGDESDLWRIPFDWPTCRIQPGNLQTDAWRSSNELKHEEFTRSVSLALFDYLRKSRQRGFIVSLSGGVDSAAVAVLVSTMIQFALQELPVESFAAAVGWRATPERPQMPKTPQDWTAYLLTTVYQSTRNSSDTTRHAARDVAKAIGATHMEIDIDALVSSYTTLVSQALGRELDWKTDDLALQNIQARVRSPGVWMIANIKNALLLATSNRSESAVGYTTMDGDTSGGLSPIAGIDKAYLRHWLRWMEMTGPIGIGPLPVLQVVNRQAPTAELRPSSQHQTDEADLMPYDVLDRIERLAVRDKLMPLEIWRHLQAELPTTTAQQLAAWVIKFFRLWCRNQWKRERTAPSFHLDDENLDPKTWCRFPILSGGFELEIAQLEGEARKG